MGVTPTTPQKDAGWRIDPPVSDPMRHDSRSLRNRRGRTAARSTGDAIKRHRVAHRSKRGVLVRRAHGELVAICFAENDSAGLFQAHNGGSVVGRDVVFEQPRPAGGSDAFGNDDVFHRERNAGQRSSVFSSRQFLIHAFCRGQRAFRTEMEIRVSLRILSLGEFDSGLRQFDGGELACRESGLHLLDGQCGNVSHRSITLGTL